MKQALRLFSASRKRCLNRNNGSFVRWRVPPKERRTVEIVRRSYRLLCTIGTFSTKRGVQGQVRDAAPESGLARTKDRELFPNDKQIRKETTSGCLHGHLTDLTADGSRFRGSVGLVYDSRCISTTDLRPRTRLPDPPPSRYKTLHPAARAISRCASNPFGVYD